MADNDQLVFCALGGTGEIGRNMALYGFGPPRKRKWLMVDCGVSFAGEDLPGIDLVMPDITFIERQKQNLVGIVVTHAHEDHYGALVHLAPRLGAPVYATRFTAAMLEAKHAGHRGAAPLDLHVVPQRAKLQLGPFDVELVDVAHSIPEANALAIRTPAGLVIHTGDWKIDPTPAIAPLTDEQRLREFGDEGVLALICDSTNAPREGRSPSERDVAASLAELMADRPGRIAITTFASNVGRMRSIAEAAARVDRQVLVVGRAMARVAQIAREQGLLDGIPPFLSADNYSSLPRDRVVAMLTGSQGEPRAALARIARDDHPEVTLSAGDTVILSSRTIPGNEKPVGSIINDLIAQGVEVITDRTHLVHVSGHPRRGELQDMYAWTRPRIAVPVHGERLHLSSHAQLARELGVPDVLIPRDGDMILLNDGAPAVIDQVQVGRLCLDGEILLNAAAEPVAERRRLAFAGSVAIAIALSDRGEIVAEPDVKILGLPASTREGAAMDDFVADKALEALENLPRGKRRDPDLVESAVERSVRAAINFVWGKKPQVQVIVLVV